MALPVFIAIFILLELVTFIVVSAAVNDPEPLEEPEKVRLVLPVIKSMSNLLDDDTFIDVSAAVRFPVTLEEPEIFMLVFPAVISRFAPLDPDRSTSRSPVELKPAAVP